MKPYYLIPLIFLPACSTAPKLTLQPLPPATATDDSAIRYPEAVRAYYVGRYVDPNDDLVMHEQHVVYRVEENTRWNFHPGPADGVVPAPPPARDAAFSPVPVNNDILAQVNSQRIATAEIMAQARVLSGALAQFQAALHQTKTNLQETAMLRAAVMEMNQRLDALEAAQKQAPPPVISPVTNSTPDALGP
ncbi:MAG TPA: hypothetical protein VMD27_06015 [Candidatus Aquilonibacter sp.]|nr:hypothetical protein [Candidatus Aquilonibacter sp.]